MEYWEGKTQTPAFSLKRKNKNLYIPYPKQLYLHYAHNFCDEILYGGSAGGGKTHSMLWDAYIKCIKYPGIRIGIFRRKFPELERTFIQKSKLYFDKSIGKYNEKTKTWTIYTNSVPSHIEFCHCKNESDVYAYQSAEYDVLYIDELTHWTEFMYSYLITRLRSANTSEMKLKPHVICATNPGGVGHGWVRKRWRLYNQDVYYKIFIDTDSTKVLDSIGIKEEPLKRIFLPARVFDNYYIVKNDPKYILRLQSSPFAKQLLEGDWSIFAGQAFSDFIEEKHAIQSFEIPPDWKRYVSIDYGYSNPFCALWHAIDPATNKIYTYKEVYKTRLSDIEQAELIKQINGNDKIECYIADPSVFSAKGSGTSIGDVWISQHLNVVKGNNNRIAGWQRMHDWLSMDDEGKPNWYIFKDKCPNLVRTLPEMVYSTENPEDIDTDAEDHAVDSARYFLMHINPPFKVNKISEDKIFAKLDPVSKAEWQYVKEKILIRREDNTSIANELRGMDV